MQKIEQNGLEQLLILRRHYLPDGDDTIDDLAAAAWLDQHDSEKLKAAVCNGIGIAFKGT